MAYNYSLKVKERSYGVNAVKALLALGYQNSFPLPVEQTAQKISAYGFILVDTKKKVISGDDTPYGSEVVPFETVLSQPTKINLDKVWATNIT